MSKKHIPAVKLKIDAILSEISTASPRSIAWQLFKNEAQVETLLEEGDLVEIPRSVTHGAEFFVIEDAESFIETAGKFGFSVCDKHIHEDDEDFAEFKVCVTIVRSDSVDIESVDALSLNVCELVERFKGVYHGWESLGSGVIKQQDFE